jgi:hypothetical protein
MHIFTDRDQGFARQAAIAVRLRSKFDEAAQSVTNWTAGDSMRLRGFQAASSSKELHWVEEYQFVVRN